MNITDARQARRDQLYAPAMAEVAPFEFNKAVSEVFDDMIRRSVPGYDTVVHMTGALVADICAAHRANGTPGVVYDLGCSLGEASASLLSACAGDAPRLVLVDNSAAMMARCRPRFENVPAVECLCADVNEISFLPASAVILNYTLQFIAQARRSALLGRVSRALLPGGMLVVSEKIRFEPAARNEEAIRQHHAFKRIMGYSQREILQKQAALDTVLVPDTLDCLQSRLQSAGFTRIRVWFECLNWVSIVAYKHA